MVVLTQLPLKSILRSANYTGSVVKWCTILGAFDIKYMPRTSVKGQVLVDLVAEFAECLEGVNVGQHGMDKKSVGIISAVSLSLESVCRWGSKPARIRNGASSSIS